MAQVSSMWCQPRVVPCGPPLPVLTQELANLGREVLTEQFQCLAP